MKDTAGKSGNKQERVSEQHITLDLMFGRTVAVSVTVCIYCIAVSVAVSEQHVSRDLMFDRRVGVSEPSNSFIGF